MDWAAADFPWEVVMYLTCSFVNFRHWYHKNSRQIRNCNHFARFRINVVAVDSELFVGYRVA